jgi:hypothetical protein
MARNKEVPPPVSHATYALVTYYQDDILPFLPGSFNILGMETIRAILLLFLY